LGPARSPGLLGNITEHVLTRSLRDSATVLDAVSGPMPGDLFAAPAPERPYLQELERAPGPLRVGILTHDPFLSLPIHAGCLAALDETRQLLESLGHRVEESYPPALEGPTGLGEALRIISTSGLAARLEAWAQRTGRAIGPQQVEPATWAAAELGRTYSA